MAIDLEIRKSGKKLQLLLDFLSLLYQDKRDMKTLQSIHIKGFCQYMGHHRLAGVALSKKSEKETWARPP